MTTGQKPWDGVIPAEDIEAFGGAFAQQYRPISAGTRPAVIVVDMTREFVDSSYPTGFSPTGVPAVAAISALLDVARSADLPIFYTKTFADPNYKPRPAERGRWKALNPADGASSRSLPPGDVIVDELAPQPEDIVIHKGFRPSGFNSTHLGPCMVQAECDTAIVTGMSTSGCVRATLLDAFQLGLHCIVPFECVADRSQLSHKVNLFDMHMKYADVVSLDETIDYIEKLAWVRSSHP